MPAHDDAQIGFKRGEHLACCLRIAACELFQQGVKGVRCHGRSSAKKSHRISGSDNATASRCADFRRIASAAIPADNSSVAKPSQWNTEATPSSRSGEVIASRAFSKVAGSNV